DELRITTDEEINAVLDLDLPLLDDEPLALILASLGQETLHAKLRPAGGRLLSLGDLQTLLQELNGLIEIFEPLIEGGELEIIIGNFGNELRNEVVSAFDRLNIAVDRRITSVAQ